MLWVPVAGFVAGLVLLVAGAELLVRGASRLALNWGVSPLVVGLTIVAFGTSSPELAVSLGAAFEGRPDLVVGNAVGSNIFNILFILGLTSLIAPLPVQQQLIRIDVPILIGLCLIFWVFSIDGHLGRAEGALFLAGIVAYTAMTIHLSRREAQPVTAEYSAAFAPAASRKHGQWVTWLMVLLGLGLCVLGGRLMVQGAAALARGLGMSELIIGLTILAAGTSLPEVATSVLAALRGQRDIAVGNVIGSNIFNLLGILGITATLSPRTVEVATSVMRFDIPVMLATTVACLPILFSGRMILRWEGAALLTLYAAYLIRLLLTG